MSSMKESDLNLILRATAFSALKHRDQRRKDPAASPYVNHPIALANVLAIEGGVQDSVTLSAALLHDTLEDTDTTSDEIEGEFGARIAAVVVEVTDDKTLMKADRKRLQIEHASIISREAKLVKLADKICNLRDITSALPKGWSLDRRREYFDWAKQVIDQLRGTHAALETLFDAEYEKKP